MTTFNEAVTAEPKLELPVLIKTGPYSDGHVNTPVMARQLATANVYPVADYFPNFEKPEATLLVMERNPYEEKLKASVNSDIHGAEKYAYAYFSTDEKRERDVGDVAISTTVNYRQLRADKVYAITTLNPTQASALVAQAKTVLNENELPNVDNVQAENWGAGKLAAIWSAAAIVTAIPYVMDKVIQLATKMPGSVFDDQQALPLIIVGSVSAFAAGAETSHLWNGAKNISNYAKSFGRAAALIAIPPTLMLAAGKAFGLDPSVVKSAASILMTPGIFAGPGWAVVDANRDGIKAARAANIKPFAAPAPAVA